MIPELGNFSLVLALGLSVLLAVVPLWGTYRGNLALMNTAPALTTGIFVFVAFAFAMLIAVLVGDDFSVKYVAGHSNSKLPVYYKVSAAWGGHEGSLLLWVLILAGWALAVSVFSKGLSTVMRARVLSVLGMIAIGFLAFMLFTSNPFDRTLPFYPQDGADLNPLLQDIGLILHPPMLYFGYVGFAVPFAFAIATLMGGQLDAAWARWSRPWTNLAWAFLGAGITLGSWWAYYELGWGGWWFWDPVENASFMPWLMGTALVHSLAVTEKRGVFRSWTVLLAIFTFSLSLLGTFLVRSGVITSVHAFAADPTRGIFILMFLFVVIGASLLLFALRAPEVSRLNRLRFLSRESFLLINNIVLTVATLTVLFGTLYPIVADALELGKYSVGAPYFNAVFIPMMVVLAAFMGPAPRLDWKNTRVFDGVKTLAVPAVVCLLLATIFPTVYGDDWHWSVVLGVLVGSWIVVSTLRDVVLTGRLKERGFAGLAKLSRSYWGMVLGHIGFAFIALGVALTSHYSVEKDVSLHEGGSVTLADYRFVMDKVHIVEGPNYVADQGVFTVYKGERKAATLTPEKRRYLASNQVMTEAGIDGGLFRDLYVSLGEPLDSGAWAVRVHVKPFVRWLWIGGILMSLGGVLTLTDARYRQRSKARAPVAGAVPAQS